MSEQKAPPKSADKRYQLPDGHLRAAQVDDVQLIPGGSPEVLTNDQVRRLTERGIRPTEVRA